MGTQNYSHVLSVMLQDTCLLYGESLKNNGTLTNLNLDFLSESYILYIELTLNNIIISSNLQSQHFVLASNTNIYMQA